MGYGAIVGGILGGVGSGIQAANTKKQMAKMRRRQRKATQSARNFAGGTTVTTGQGFFGDKGTQVALGPGTVVTDEMLEEGLPKGVATFIDPVTGERKIGGRVDEIMADPLLTMARDFLQGTFENAADSPLAQDFAKGIAAAQAARGTYFGGSGISAEAGGLAAFSQRLRQDLLPSTIQFATLGEQLRQSILGFEANLRTAAATGGAGLGDASNMMSPSVAGAIFQGAASGMAAGYSMDRQFNWSPQWFGGAPQQQQPGYTGGGTQAALGSNQATTDQMDAMFEQYMRNRGIYDY